MELLQLQAASTVANQMGVQADALVQAVISDRNDNALPAIRPQNRTTAFPGNNTAVDSGYRLDSKDQRFQAMHLIAGLVMANAGDQSLLLNVYLQIRRSDTNKVLDYVVTLYNISNSIRIQRTIARRHTRLGNDVIQGIHSIHGNSTVIRRGHRFTYS